MAKQLLTDPITETDIRQYLESESDFQFELKVLTMLTDRGFECDHGGTYTDSITGKLREFDIRAIKKRQCEPNPTGNYKVEKQLLLAVECKNIQPNYPLLVHATTSDAESEKHCLVWNGHSKPGVSQTSATTIWRYERDSRYHRCVVGRNVEQIGKTNDNRFNAADRGVFPKISQSLSSAEDLVKRSLRPEHREGPDSFRFICPILVIPNGTLWEVTYGANGNRDDPKMVPEVLYYVGRHLEACGGDDNDHHKYLLSHIHIVSVDTLVGHIDRLMGGCHEEFWYDSFETLDS